MVACMKCQLFSLFTCVHMHAHLEPLLLTAPTELVTPAAREPPRHAAHEPLETAQTINLTVWGRVRVQNLGDALAELAHVCQYRGEGPMPL